jgi:putative ABC transport system ATP-binding protein
MIHIHVLTFHHQHGEFRLHVPELIVAQSEKVAVIGPSGSGKTTLLHLIAGIFLPSSGEICIGDVRVHTLTDAERRDFRITSIGLVFQDFELLDYLNVLDNILHPYRITRVLVLDKIVRTRAGELVKKMGIEDKLGRFPDELSQGEKQRVAICRALLPQPKLILADEATGNLDPENKHIILDLLFESVNDHDAALLAVTHDHDLLSRFDRVIDFQHFRKEVPS